MRWSTEFERLKKVCESTDLFFIELLRRCQLREPSTRAESPEGYPAGHTPAISHHGFAWTHHRSLDHSIPDHSAVPSPSPLFNANPALIEGTHGVDLAILQILEVLEHRRCKRMMGARPSTLGKQRLVLVGSGEERELGDPENVRLFRESHQA